MSEQAKKKGFFSRLFTGDAPPPAAEEKSEASPSQTTPAEPASHTPQPEAKPADAAETAEREPVAVAPPASPPAPDDPVEASPAKAPAPAEADATPAPLTSAPAEKKTSWFSRLKTGLGRTSSKLSDGITGLFTKSKLDADTLDDLEDLLIQADLGVETSMRITAALSQGRYQKGISADDVRQVLAAEVARVLEPVARPLEISAANKPHVVLMVGVNGTGKTTTIGKLAQRYAREGKKVMMAAGDTFRAAAIDQLKVWGQRSGATVVSRDVGADASGLAFDALKQAQTEGYDLLLVDTAGRLQNKQALMDELEKVIRVLQKLDPTAPHDVLLVLDATTGQNALNQVDVFRQRAGVTGLVLTKLDGTARGGIIVAIAERSGLPVHAIGVGEGIDDLQPFAAHAFAKAIADVA
ncbi:MAG: signal recognition particle-docking protein FtsY [Hyphomicrobiaceae bacterium]|nr:signal recognition particle-docking protein FtsY [Hyphomicrobiaceae bacterium]MCC0007437.1 signal recognition particle-docking protein FtsY [Hyphomicrobiaceae bacterium]